MRPSEARFCRIRSFTDKPNSIAEPMLKSLTYDQGREVAYDQGREVALHKKLTEQTGMAVYFCDPHSPWQHGSNENTNGLVHPALPSHFKDHCMDHNISLITTLAAGFGIALILGFLAERIRVPALVGYLVAGIIIGPGTPGFVADVQLASQLSEIGVMLLMFGVGLHFSLDDLLAVKRIAVPGAVVQMGLATLLGMAVAWGWDWSWGSGLIFGLSLSCASTVVLLKALESRGVLESMNGRIAVGWLVVEDLATVLVLVLLPPLAGVLGGSEAAHAAAAKPLWITIGQTLLQVGAFLALMLIAGRRVLPWMLWQVSRTGSRELFTLAVVASAIGIAYGALRCSASRLPSGPSSPAWSCASRNSVIARRKSPCLYAMRSPCSSSYRWACCSIPRFWWNSPGTCWLCWRSSFSASPSRHWPSCWLSAIRSIRR